MEITNMICASIGAWMATSPVIGNIIVNVVYYSICLLIAEIGWTSHQKCLLTGKYHTYYTYNKDATVVKIVAFVLPGAAYLYVNACAWRNPAPEAYFTAICWSMISTVLSFSLPFLACATKDQRQYNTRDAQP